MIYQKGQSLSKISAVNKSLFSKDAHGKASHDTPTCDLNKVEPGQNASCSKFKWASHWYIFFSR